MSAVWFHLDEVRRVVRRTETEGSRVVAGSRGRVERAQSCVAAVRALAFGCTAADILNLLTCALTMVQLVNFMLHVFYHN